MFYAGDSQTFIRLFDEEFMFLLLEFDLDF